MNEEWEYEEWVYDEWVNEEWEYEEWVYESTRNERMSVLRNGYKANLGRRPMT